MTDANPSMVERLFGEHRAALQSFFRRRIRGKADAPDLVREVYLRMLRITDEEAIRSPVRYLYTVANNLVKEHEYGSTERLITLTSGEASFEVAHESDRAFRVLAGSAQIVAVGTKFDVYLEHDATVVTVIEGRVAVGPSSDENQPTRFVELGAGQQVSLTSGEWPPKFAAVDSQRATAWLHRQISFEHEPLERVAAEYNRYAPKPIEISTPALRTLIITGVFATDDPQEFIVFLRSLKGVRVEVTDTQIRVSGDEAVLRPGGV